MLEEEVELVINRETPGVVEFLKLLEICYRDKDINVKTATFLDNHRVSREALKRLRADGLELDPRIVPACVMIYTGGRSQSFIDGRNSASVHTPILDRVFFKFIEKNPNAGARQLRLVGVPQSIMPTLS